MNDVVTAVFYNAKGEQLTIAKSDSIASYATRKLNDAAVANNAELRTVYVDMLNYGAAAQVQFEYDIENLANSGVTAEQQAWATESVETADHRASSTGYAGSTLTLNNEIQLDFVFTNASVGYSHNDLYAIATFTDHYGHAKEVRIEGENFIDYGNLGVLCEVSVTGMAVADFRSVVTCTVYSADGTALEYATDSIEGYAYRNREKLGAIVDAIVKFGESSYNYFH